MRPYSQAVFAFARLADPLKLIKWKEFLLSAGWGQGHYSCYPSGYCVVGALAHGVYNHSVSTAEDSDEHMLVTQIVTERYGWTDSLPSWNDVPGRTVQEVADVLEEAYQIVKGQRIEGAP